MPKHLVRLTLNRRVEDAPLGAGKGSARTRAFLAAGLIGEDVCAGARHFSSANDRGMASPGQTSN